MSKLTFGRILDGPGALCCAVFSFYRWLLATYLLFKWHVFGLIIGMMSLYTMPIWHVFTCGCNMLSIRWWLKKRRKIRSIIKIAARRTGTWAPRIYAIVKMLLVFHPLFGEVASMLRLPWHWALEADHGPSLAGGFTFCLGCFQCLLQTGEVAATSWSQNKVISTLSLFWRCV
jgi:hypothetical protein